MEPPTLNPAQDYTEVGVVATHKVGYFMNVTYIILKYIIVQLHAYGNVNLVEDELKL